MWEEIIFCPLQKLLLRTLISFLAGPPCRSFFIKWRKEKEMEEDKEMLTWLFSFGKSGRFVILVIVKWLLRHINHHDRVLPLRVTCRSPVSIGSGTCLERLWVASAIPHPSSMPCRLQSSRMPVLFLEGFWESSFLSQREEGSGVSLAVLEVLSCQTPLPRSWTSSRDIVLHAMQEEW